MRQFPKMLALLLALIMFASAAPIMAVPEARAADVTFDLVIDDDGDDEDVTYPDNMGEAPAGEDLYDGVTPVGLSLDWDSWATIFGDMSDVPHQDINFTLWRETAIDPISPNVPPEELGYAIYEDTSKVAIINDTSKVKVLNVYPIPASENLLNDWLEMAYQGHKYGKAYTDDFEIDTVLLDRRAAIHAGVEYYGLVFNEDCNEILSKGYDVIFFGTSDGNGDLPYYDSEYVYPRTFYDLSAEAYEAVDEFIKNGHGVLFGHDTVCSADHLDGEAGDYEGFDYFTKFADELGIICLEGRELVDVIESYNSSVERSEQVEVINSGLLTSYPFTIDSHLTVPETHSMYQKVPIDSSATVWMRLRDTDGDGRYFLGDEFSSYLLTNNNVAMIQTGHSSHSEGVASGAVKQEGQVIANTLFYLKQRSVDHYSTDGGFVDNASPFIDRVAFAAITDFQPTDGTAPQHFNADITISADDYGTAYKYFVEAQSDNSTVAASNEVYALAISNLKGYLVEVNESEALIGADVMAEARKDAADPTNRTILVDVESDSAPQSEVSAFNTRDIPDCEDGLEVVPGKSYYVHIVPVDNANNYGNEIVVKISFDDLYTPSVETEIEAVIPENDTIPEDSRVEDIPSEDGSGTEKVTCYYPGNYLDKDDNEFDERQEDKEIVFDITASVDCAEREIIGTLVIVDKDGNEVKRIEELEATPSYGYPLKEQLSVTIEDIYDEDDYDEDGEFTATITWNDKAAGDQVAEDECRIIIRRPDYKVTFNYVDADRSGNAVEKDESQYVKHGDNAKALSIPERVKTNTVLYIFDKWDAEYANITSDMTISAAYAESGVTPKMTSAASKLYEPWGIKFFAAYEGVSSDRIIERGVVILKDINYSTDLTPQEFCDHEKAYTFTTSDDSLTYVDSTTKYPNGRYSALLDKDIYSYDISARYYALPFAQTDDGEIYYGKVINTSMETVLRSNLNSDKVTDKEKTVCSAILDLKSSIAAHYEATGILGADVATNATRGSSQIAAEKILTSAETDLTPKITSAASRLIEPWGIKFKCNALEDDRIADYGIVLLEDKYYTTDYMSAQDSMRLNPNSYVFALSDGSLHYSSSTSQYSALLNKDLSSKDIDRIYYAVPYVILNDGSYVYGAVRNSSMMKIMSFNLTQNDVPETEKAVIRDITALFDAVTAYYAD